MAMTNAKSTVRPTNDRRKHPTLSCATTRAMYERVQADALERKLPVSMIINEALRAYFGLCQFCGAGPGDVHTDCRGLKLESGTDSV